MLLSSEIVTLLRLLLRVFTFPVYPSRLIHTELAHRDHSPRIGVSTNDKLCELRQKEGYNSMRELPVLEP